METEMETDISVRDLYRQYRGVERALQCLLTIKDNCIPELSKGSRLTIFLDAYDILDWFFPPGITFHDEHYATVHNLWKTVEKYFPPHPRNIHLCIPPFSALEMFHLLKIKSDQLTKIELPCSKISRTYYNNLLNKLGALYSAVNEIIKELGTNPNKGPILTAFKEGHIEALRSLIDLSRLNKTEREKIVGRELNINHGYKYILEQREKSRPNASDKTLKTGAIFDLANLGLVTFLREKSQEFDIFPIMTTHALFTIFGWKRATRNPEKKAYSHSLLALYLFKGLQKTIDLKEFTDVIEGASGHCKEYLKILGKNEQLQNAIKNKNFDSPDKINLSRTELLVQRAWHAIYEDTYFGLENFETSQKRKMPTENDFIDWSLEKRKKQQEMIQEQVKLIERRANFIDPEIVNILVDKNELVDEILEYASP